MSKKKNYLARYYERATIDQLVDEYTQKGYVVHRDYKIGKYRVDLMAEKDGKRVFIEVVKEKMGGEARRRAEALEGLIRQQPNSRLIVVPLRYSDEKQIEFHDLNEIFFDYFLNDFPDELDELSSHTKLDSIDSVNISELKIYGQDIVIKCNGQVTVELQYGSDSEQDEKPLSTMSFPFDFGGTVSWMDDKYIVSEVDYLRIDAGEYYE